MTSRDELVVAGPAVGTGPARVWSWSTIMFQRPRRTPGRPSWFELTDMPGEGASVYGG